MILAIDPGTEKSAFVVMDGTEIKDKGIFNNQVMIGGVFNLHTDCDRLAIEMIASYGMPVGKEVFETCVWIGRFVQEAFNRNLDVTMIYRKDVKMHLCGSTKAKDANIRQALIDMLGKEATRGVKKDMWAALGVAVTAVGVQ